MKKQQSSAEESQKAEIGKKIKAVDQKFADNHLGLLKTFGDMISATQAISLPKNTFGFDFNDSHIGVGGMVSAGITCYQLFPKAK